MRIFQNGEHFDGVLFQFLIRTAGEIGQWTFVRWHRAKYNINKLYRLFSNLIYKINVEFQSHFLLFLNL